MKTIRFVRDFTRFSGGHLKIFDYFNHVMNSGEYAPVLTFTSRSRMDDTNPWFMAGFPFSERFGPSDAYFVGGLDWELFDQAGVDLHGKPVINLVQHVRHASPQDVRYRFLQRPALRICVSPEVADAVRATGIVNGEVVTIANGVDLEPLRVLSRVRKSCDVFVGGLKSAELALACAATLRANGLRVTVETASLPRDAYLRRVASAHIALLLPNPAEGFYLPALEAMASDVCVVVPDCIGNRSFCRDGVNCVISSFEMAALTQAVIDLVAFPKRQESLKTEARKTAAAHDLVIERAKFLDILSQLERWISHAG